MPPINKTVDVEAKDAFYSTLTVPIAQKGYIPIPPMLSMEILKNESAYDAEMFVNGSVKKFGELFGCDAVLFTTINRYQRKKLSAKIIVEIQYVLKSTKTDEILFERTGKLVYSPNNGSSNNGSLLAMAIDHAINMIDVAVTKKVTVARACNSSSLGVLPEGKYSSLHKQDTAFTAGKKVFSETISSATNL